MPPASKLDLARAIHATATAEYARLLKTAQNFLEGRFLSENQRAVALAPGGVAYGNSSPFMKVLLSDRALRELREENYTMLQKRALKIRGAEIQYNEWNLF